MKGVFMLGLAVLGIAVAGFALWVRLAPSDPGRWHVPPPEARGSFRWGVVEELAGGQARFDRLADIIAASARTRLLAGSKAEGRMTFVSRSALWGFPDYTTISRAGNGARIIVHARLRFGGSDLGVNRARVEGWIEALEPVEK